MNIIWRIVITVCTGGILLTSCSKLSPEKTGSIQAVPLEKVQLDQESLLGERIGLTMEHTLWHNLEMLEKRGYFHNFRLAAGEASGDYRGNVHGYADSEVYKFIEGASYIYALTGDTSIVNSLDTIVDLIARAQFPNGHLQTRDAFLGKDTLYPNNAWSNHRMYNAGHLYEGAVAHHHFTGREELLEVAVKNADLMVAVSHDTTLPLITPGHPEIETGLMTLFHHTANQEYFDLAERLIILRGGPTDTGQGKYDQKHLPVKEQREAVGHAVRAKYLYTGITDLVAATGDTSYWPMLDAVWENIVTRKMYITGGTGAHHRIMENGSLRGWEGFGENFELPNDSYCESCAAISNAIWNHKLFLLEGHAKYYDVIERILYNNGMSMLAVDGCHFFYQNELRSDHDTHHARRDWADCCTNNILRFYPQLPGYFYATRDNELYVNLYGTSEATFGLLNSEVTLSQETRYPWDGEIKLTVRTNTPAKVALHLRVPAWVRGQPFYGNLYHYPEELPGNVKLELNDNAIPLQIENGYAAIEARRWNEKDTLTIRFPMMPRRVLAHEAVESCRSRVALERGPVVFCIESQDHEGSTHDLILPDTSALVFARNDTLLGGTYVISTDATDISSAYRSIMAIPYYLWAHRGPGEMDVWINRRRNLNTL